MRVYELAKELGRTSKDLLALLHQDMSIEVKGHMSGLDDEIVAKVKVKVAGNFSVDQETPVEKSKEEDTPKVETKAKAKPEPLEEALQETTDSEDDTRELSLKFPITVGNLAKKLNVKVNELIKKLMHRKIFASINQEISRELVEDLLLDYNCFIKEKVVVVEETVVVGDIFAEIDDVPENLELRAPIVTMMGHVDHGKTSLLDAFRDTSVTAGEAGGITQHIGAYEVSTDHGNVAFIDTPGHEAFTAMRARGAQVTDIVVLVIAADDGVRPQTVEAINHAKAAEVPIIVAVNKCDKPEADPQRVRTQLTEYDLLAEDWGGKTIFVEVSAHSGQGLSDLIEMLILEAEMLELKANPNRSARGVVFEAHLDKGRGVVATLMVTAGTLKVGDIVVAGKSYGKVRALMNHQGKRLKLAGPSTPVEVLGFGDIPIAGDQFAVVKSEKEARSYQKFFLAQAQEQQLSSGKKVMTLEDLYSHISQGDIKELNIVLKSDNTGSMEALKESLVKLSNDQVDLKILHQGVGTINESDVVLARASGAIIIGFHVNSDSQATQTAERDNVDIRIYNIIYEVVDEVRNAMEGILDAKDVQRNIGIVEVRATFKSSKVGLIAGCDVSSGQVKRGSFVRVIRGNEQVADDKIHTLRREKDDVREVNEGYECGIVLDKFKDVQEGDIFEIYVVEKQKQFLN